MPPSRNRRVVVVLGDAGERDRVAAAFRAEAPKVELTVCGDLASARAAADPVPAAWIAELHLPDGEATDLVEDPPRTPLVILVPPGHVTEGIEALHEGAVDWVQKTPGALDALPHLARSAVREWREVVRRREAEERLRHADRLATVGRIAAGVIHEVGTPLNVIRMQAQLLALDPDDVPAATDKMVEQCDRIADILRRTLDLSRSGGSGTGTVDLRRLADDAATLLAPTLRRGHVSARVEGPPVDVRGDAQALLQVVLNLLTNALDAMPDGGRITLTVAADPARLVVHDTGPGVPASLIPTLFVPFVTTKAPGKGTGLGLHVSSEFAREHGATLTVANHPDGGAVFTLAFP